MRGLRNRSTQVKSFRLWLAALLCAAAALTWAGGAYADPPARVARLAYINGAVSFSPAGEDIWVEAAINRPLITGDRLWVDNGSRAELQVGSAVFYLGAGTSVSLLNLDNRAVQLEVTQGSIISRVRRFGPRDLIEFDTPNLAFSVRRPGVYRIDVDAADDSTAVAARNGQADVYGDGAAYRVNAGQAFRFYGSDLRDYDNLEAAAGDDFERWSDTRYRRTVNSASARYVSRDVIGYEDLDEVRHVALVARIRQRVVPRSGSRGLGAVSRRTLGVGGTVGLDMDRRCAVWFCRFALRALGEYRQPMGLGAGPVECAARVRACTRRLHRRCGGRRGAFKPQYRQRRLVSARSARCLSTGVSGEPHLLQQRQYQQHDRQ